MLAFIGDVDFGQSLISSTAHLPMDAVPVGLQMELFQDYFLDSVVKGLAAAGSFVDCSTGCPAFPSADTSKPDHAVRIDSMSLACANQTRSCPTKLMVNFTVIVPTHGTFSTNEEEAVEAFKTMAQDFRTVVDTKTGATARARLDDPMVRPYGTTREVGTDYSSDLHKGTTKQTVSEQTMTESHLDEHHFFFIGLSGSVVGLLAALGHWRLVGRSIDEYVGADNIFSKIKQIYTSRAMELDIRDPERRIKKLYYSHETSTNIDTVSVATEAQPCKCWCRKPCLCAAS